MDVRTLMRRSAGFYADEEAMTLPADFGAPAWRNGPGTVVSSSCWMTPTPAAREQSDEPLRRSHVVLSQIWK
jgi:hypothetical protein